MVRRPSGCAHLSERHTMKILFLDNGGAGFADYVNVPEGTTISAFLDRHLPSRDPGDLLIRVNRQPVSADHVLHEGDRVSATPLKIDGASAVAA